MAEPTKPGHPPPLCGHTEARIHHAGHRLLCSKCGSFWDIRSLNDVVTYDDDYPEIRGHFNADVGRLKVRTLRDWLHRTSVTPRGLSICEVGFGAGYCLQELRAAGARVFGVEVVTANLEHAVDLGIETDRLYHAEWLPEKLSEPIDLWIFQDSFEHIPDPGPFADWLLSNSAPNARVLIVLPEAGSISERFLGRWWPHRVPDHQFHWSAKAIREFWERRDFILKTRFNPTKWVSPSLLTAHIRILTRSRRRKGVRGRFAFRFNIGEFGGLFERANLR